jgi:hypothetical protein
MQYFRLCSEHTTEQTAKLHAETYRRSEVYGAASAFRVQAHCTFLRNISNDPLDRMSHTPEYNNIKKYCLKT